MKLEINHIYAYMPYGLQIKYPNSGEIYTVEVINEADYINNEYPLSTVIHCIETQDLSPLNFKLLLKPLSEFSSFAQKVWARGVAQEAWFGGEDYKFMKFTSEEGRWVCDVILTEEIQEIGTDNLTAGLYNLLLKHHYDVFGLIDNGLAEVLCD